MGTDYDRDKGRVVVGRVLDQLGAIRCGRPSRFTLAAYDGGQRSRVGSGLRLGVCSDGIARRYDQIHGSGHYQEDASHQRQYGTAFFSPKAHLSGLIHGWTPLSSTYRGGGVNRKG